jgi:hypothetical protein
MEKRKVIHANQIMAAARGRSDPIQWVPYDHSRPFDLARVMKDTSLVWKSSDNQLFLFRNAELKPSGGTDGSLTYEIVESSRSQYVLASVHAVTKDMMDFLDTMQQECRASKIDAHTSDGGRTKSYYFTNAAEFEIPLRTSFTRVWGDQDEINYIKDVCTKAASERLHPQDIVIFVDWVRHTRNLISYKGNPKRTEKGLHQTLEEVVGTVVPRIHNAWAALKDITESSKDALVPVLVAYTFFSNYGLAIERSYERYSTIAAIMTITMSRKVIHTILSPSWCLYQGIVVRQEDGKFVVKEPPQSTTAWFTKIYSNSVHKASIDQESRNMEKIEWALRPCGKPCADLILQGDTVIIPEVPGARMRYFSTYGGPLGRVQELRLEALQNLPLFGSQMLNLDSVEKDLAGTSIRHLHAWNLAWAHSGRPEVGGSFVESTLAGGYSSSDGIIMLFVVGTDDGRQPNPPAIEDVIENFGLRQQGHGYIRRWTKSADTLVFPPISEGMFASTPTLPTFLEKSKFFTQHDGVSIRIREPDSSILPCTPHTLSKFVLRSNLKFNASARAIQGMIDDTRTFNLEDLVLVNNTRLEAITTYQPPSWSFVGASAVGRAEAFWKLFNFVEDITTECKEEEISRRRPVPRYRAPVASTRTSSEALRVPDSAPSPAVVHSQLVHMRLPVMPSYLLPMRHSRSPSRPRHSRSRHSRSRSGHSRSRRSRRSRSRSSRSRSRTYVPRSRLS